jgi:hypothetical protein
MSCSGYADLLCKLHSTGRDLLNFLRKPGLKKDFAGINPAAELENSRLIFSGT